MVLMIIHMAMFNYESEEHAGKSKKLQGDSVHHMLPDSHHSAHDGNFTDNRRLYNNHCANIYTNHNIRANVNTRTNPSAVPTPPSVAPTPNPLSLEQMVEEAPALCSPYYNQR